MKTTAQILMTNKQTFSLAYALVSTSLNMTGLQGEKPCAQSQCVIANELNQKFMGFNYWLGKQSFGNFASGLFRKILQ